ncbi:hypothetical protein NPIL_180861 [Nephila pilipes]|uniref:Uncharacterized protein n=1 Tax=Nephila pilipes TaxID=299642 RepID=A0A8X6N3E1_NEPPI|nr:hypothetical protein NPIL_180861 [Nephila pilipes]
MARATPKIQGQSQERVSLRGVVYFPLPSFLRVKVSNSTKENIRPPSGDTRFPNENGECPVRDVGLFGRKSGFPGEDAFSGGKDAFSGGKHFTKEENCRYKPRIVYALMEIT